MRHVYRQPTLGQIDKDENIVANFSSMVWKTFDLTQEEIGNSLPEDSDYELAKSQ